MTRHALFTFLWLSLPSHAAVIHYDLLDAVLDNGVTVTGSFEFDAAAGFSGLSTAWDFNTSDGFSYTPADSRYLDKSPGLLWASTTPRHTLLLMLERDYAANPAVILGSDVHGSVHPILTETFGMYSSKHAGNPFVSGYIVAVPEPSILLVVLVGLAIVLELRARMRS